MKKFKPYSIKVANIKPVNTNMNSIGSSMKGFLKGLGKGLTGK